MYCEKCGIKLEEDSKFCEKCGAKIEGTEETEKIIPLTSTEQTAPTEPEITVPELLSEKPEIIPTADYSTGAIIQTENKKLLFVLIPIFIVITAVITVLILWSNGIFDNSEYPDEILYDGLPATRFFDMSKSDIEKEFGKTLEYVSPDGYYRYNTGIPRVYFDENGKVIFVKLYAEMCTFNGLKLNKKTEDIIKKFNSSSGWLFTRLKTSYIDNMDEIHGGNQSFLRSSHKGYTVDIMLTQYNKNEVGIDVCLFTDKWDWETDSTQSFPQNDTSIDDKLSTLPEPPTANREIDCDFLGCDVEWKHIHYGDDIHAYLWCYDCEDYFDGGITDDGKVDHHGCIRYNFSYDDTDPCIGTWAEELDLTYDDFFLAIVPSDARILNLVCKYPVNDNEYIYIECVSSTGYWVYHIADFEFDDYPIYEYFNHPAELRWWLEYCSEPTFFFNDWADMWDVEYNGANPTIYTLPNLETMSMNEYDDYYYGEVTSNPTYGTWAEELGLYDENFNYILCTDGQYRWGCKLWNYREEKFVYLKYEERGSGYWYQDSYMTDEVFYEHYNEAYDYIRPFIESIEGMWIYFQSYTEMCDFLDAKDNYEFAFANVVSIPDFEIYPESTGFPSGMFSGT